MPSPLIEPNWPVPVAVTALSTLRDGGVSTAPYDSFNLAMHVGDEAGAVQANRELLSALLPEGSAIQWLNQVHGIRVVPAGLGEPCPDADASWSRQRGQACAVLTADCLPVLFCSVDGDVVAAAHAGWRGLLGGVLEQTVEAMAAAPERLMAWLGPAIGPGAFEVGGEVRDAFVAAAAAASAVATTACFTPHPANPGHYFADLYALARLRLASLGPIRVYGGGFCTYSAAEQYFSYRRDGETGRMVSIILLNPV